MLGIQDMSQKDEVKAQLKQIKAEMDATATFHPTKCSVFNVDSYALKLELQESYRHIPLREFLAKSSTTGLMGAAYLVPDKVHSELVMSSAITDITPLISAYMVYDWKGAEALKVNITDRTSLSPRIFSTGGAIAMDEGNYAQATVTPESFGVDMQFGNDLIEDSAYDLVNVCIDQAGRAIGEYASERALTVLKTATDGWGTVNSGASGDADETKWAGATTTGIDTALELLSDDHWIGDTVVMTSEAWNHSVMATFGGEVAGGAAGDYWRPHSYAYGLTGQPPSPGFPLRALNIDILFSNSPALRDAALPGTALTSCITIVYSRQNAMLTGRKRWLQLGNYAHPWEDISGVTVTARQDSVTLYDDAICVITET